CPCLPSGLNGVSPRIISAGHKPASQQRRNPARGPNGVGECVNDPDHQWIAAHLSWNGGGNDGWLAAQARTRSQANTPVVMGYYARPDIPIHYLLADTFTICDQYHSSLLGGTMPNRLYWISGTVNPDGDKGGPQIVEPTIQPKLTFSWRLMPENLSDAGVSWKVYNSKLLGGLNDTSLSRNGYVGSFKQAGDPRSDLARYGIAPRYPADFVLDIMNNRLPQVSWVVPLTVESEHPSFPVAVGAVTIVNLIRALLRNPAVWEKTALIIAYDEHGGFFDHVTPPTPPEGTPGEWIPPTVDINTVDGSGGIRGPIGLGYRVPCFVISPYSRGGLLAHERFDHTSQLQLIGKRFGVPVPNLTPWRASVTGDMTSAFNFAVPPNPSPPNLDHPAKQLPKLINCVPNAVLGFLNEGLPYRVPYPQTTPTQESGPVRGVPSGIC
ncbi:phospholipase C, partial [Mycobacterium marinum]